MKALLGHALTILAPFAISGVLVAWANAMIGAEAQPPVKLAFAPKVADRITLEIEADFKARKVSRSLKDGAVPGLTVVTMNRKTARQLLGVLATALDCEVHQRPPAAKRPGE